MNRYLIPAAALSALVAPPAQAAFQSTAALDRAVADFAGAPAGRIGGARAPVDPRLKLAACATVSLAWRTPAQDAVVVRCSGPEWRIFVPMMMPAAAPAAAGPAPAPAAPAAAPVIRRNDPVTIEAGNGGFTITREGVALGDAAPGARLLVRVEGARGPVQATALAPGRATLPGWAADGGE